MPDPDVTPEGIAARRAAQQPNLAGCAAALVVAAVIAAGVVGLGALIGRVADKPAPPVHSGSSRTIDRATFAGHWTLRADRATVGCTLKNPPDTSIFELTLNVGGQVYGLNGKALDDQSAGYAEPPPSLFVGGVADVSDLFTAAEAMC